MSVRELTEADLEAGAQRALESAVRVTRPSLHAIARAVAAEHSLPVAALFSRARPAHVAHARQALYAALRARGLSLPQIGRFLQRDHTTVLYGIRAHLERLESEARR